MKHILLSLAIIALVVAAYIHAATFRGDIAFVQPWIMIMLDAMTVMVAGVALASVWGTRRMTHLRDHEMVRGRILYSGMPLPAKILIRLAFLYVLVQAALNWSHLDGAFLTPSLANTRVASAIWLFAFLFAGLITTFPPTVVPGETEVDTGL